MSESPTEIKKSRRKGGGPPLFGTLFVTFLLGLAIGISIAYTAPDILNRAGFDEPAAPPDADDYEPPNKAGPPSGQPEPPLAEPSPIYRQASDVSIPNDSTAGRHLFIAIEGTELDAYGAAFLEKINPRGVVLRDENFIDAQQTASFVADIKDAVSGGSDISDLPLIAVYPEYGNLARFGVDKDFSGPALGDVYDTGAALELGRRFGEACSKRGIGVVFAPALDIYESQTSSASLRETAFSSDAEVVTALGLAMAQGLVDAGVIPVAQHYPGLGGAYRESGKTLPVIDKDVPALAAAMYPYSEAVAQRIPGVMAAHVAVPTLEGDGSASRPVSMSRVLLKSVLRERWGFIGVTLADDIARAAGMVSSPVEDVAVQSLKGGCDALIYLDPAPVNIETVCNAIHQAVEEGELDEADLLESRRRLDGWQDWLQNPVPLLGHVVAEAEAEPAPEPEPQDADATPESKHVEARTAAEPARAEASTTPVQEESSNTRQVSSDAQPPDEPEPEPQQKQEVDQAPVVPLEEPIEPEDLRPEPPHEELAERTVKIERTVDPGDSLESIARETGVSKSDIMRWNDLKTDAVEPGTRLVIYATVPNVNTRQKQDNAAEARDDAKTAFAKSPESAHVRPEAHEVQPGEMLAEIAEAYGIYEDDLRRWNDMADGEVREGQTVVLQPVAEPEPRLHRVKVGENLHTIAGQYGTTPERVMELNDISNPDKILIGQEIKVPRK